MRKAMRMGWVSVVTTLVAGLVAVSCLGPRMEPGGEVTELAGLKVTESRMSARVDGSRMEFSMILQRSRNRSYSGKLVAELIDLEGTIYDRKEQSFLLEEEEQSYTFSFQGLPETDGLEDLAKYLVRYRVEWDGYALFGARSVYVAVEKLEAQVIAPSRLYEEAGTFLRVLTRDPSSGQARADVEVTVHLEKDETSRLLGHGRTDANGAAEVFIEAPADSEGQGKMVISMVTPEGTSESVDGSVEILREEKILVTTDKPIYQPGQIIHMRLLSLRRPELRPVADEDMLFEVRDGKGNKVFKHQGRTNAYGVGGADFRLANEVNMGTYEITARVGTTESVKSVEVKRYALPKFSVQFRPDRGYYLPGERVTGLVEARYFFGKPVNGTVRVKVFTFDVGLVEIGEVVGELNQEGVWSFAYTLPDTFVGIDLLQGDAYLQFDAEVTDLAEHTQKVSAVSVVAASSLKVALVPESGDLAPGVENLIHVVTADPTGMPVPAQVTLTADGLAPMSVVTNARGLGTVGLVPPADSLVLHVEAADAMGNQVEKDVALQAGKSGQTVLLRVDKRLYSVGDTAQLTVLANDTRDRIYLDVIKGNQTLLTQAIDLENGQAVFGMDLTPEMEGNVQFDAYYLTRESQIVRDTQLVLVEGARELSVGVSMDKESYLPGETASLSFDVKDLNGNGVSAAIGLSIVDEAVFALTEFRPGLAETFFEIEQDVLTPRYQVVNSSSLYDYMDEDLDDEARQASAEVTFAAARGYPGHGIEVNTYVEAAQRIGELVNTRINKDAESILEVLRAMGDQGIITPENLKTWLANHEGQWLDPFGQPYRVEMIGTYEWEQALIFHSAGPDELIASPDDVSSKYYYTWWIFSGGRGDYGWDEDFGVGDANVPGGECAGGMCGTPDDGTGKVDEGEGGGDREQPRIRSFFPETLFFHPALITDESGRATLEIPMADSITTWRMTSLASSLAGHIGSRADGILVFQDFFVDVDFPATLTRGDQVSIPVAVYNYLDQSQTVTLEIQAEPWFILQDAATKNIDMEAGGVGVAYFTVTVDKVGWHGLTVFGYGTEQSDAVRRTVEIVPDGKEFRVNRSDRLVGSLTRTISIPEEAIDDASRIFVKVYPGLMSQAVEGLDSILRIPNGCFEQTTSSAWPNIMVLNYLKNSGQLTPEIELKARDYVNMGYQRIVTFECPSGGFNWWVGDDPGNDILSAMALMMFADARESVDLDEQVVSRTEAFLERKQESDGSWGPESHLHAGNGVYGESRLRASAFCTWGLAMSGYTGPALASGVAYLRTAVQSSDDVYANALVANALAAYDSNDPVLVSLLAELEALKQVGENGEIYWSANLGTASGSYGSSSHVETTALITQALIKAGMYIDLVDGAITWLIQQKDTFGTWSTTQPTVQSLRAMTAAMDLSAGQDVNGLVSVSINGVENACTFAVNPDNSDVTRICELNPYAIEGDNVVTIALDGEGSFLYQAVGVYYLPWALVADSPDGPLSIEVSYDRTSLNVDEMVTVQVDVSYNVEGQTASMIMVDLGIPPGFEMVTEDLAALVANVASITRYEIRGRQLSIYIDRLTHGEPLSFNYRMKALYPIHGQVPESTVWAYYNPEMRMNTVPFGVDVALP